MSNQTPSFPAGILPIHTSDNPSAPIEMYDGTIEICDGSRTVTRDARVMLEWSTGASLIAHIANVGEEEFEWQMDSTQLIVSIPELHIETEARALSLTISKESKATLLLNHCKTKTRSHCSNIAFSVVNFLDYLGAPVSFRNDGSFQSSRLEFVFDEWHICIDKIPDCDDLVKRLTKEGGFGITHSGRLERADGSTFHIDKGLKVLESLRWFLSFCRGSFVGIPLVYGIDSKGDCSYKEWLAPIVRSYKYVVSWFPQRPLEDVSGAFGQFYQLYCNPDWKETLTYAIHWYVNANENLAATEGSIALAQIALERLAWMVMSIDRQAVSEDGFGRLPAADKFNLLFNQLGVPMKLPKSLVSLTAYCKSNSVKGLAESIAHFRNAIVHPPKKSRKSPTSDVLREAWDATVWSLELCILALLQYQGSYVNRTKVGTKWEGPSEPVPWAQTTIER